MASHKGWDRSAVVTSVMTDGRSLNLSRAKGAFGVVNMDSVPTKDGLKVIGGFDGLSPDTTLELRLGKSPISVNRSQSDKAWASRPFSISEVIGLKVDAPKARDYKVDEIVIGYDGFNAETALAFENGDNEELDIELSGKAMGVLGYEKAKVNFKAYFEAPNTGTFTNHEIVEKAVERIKEITLLGGVPVTDYIEVSTVNSENVALVGTDNAFFTLTVSDAGDSNAHGLVQSQYDTKVERTDRIGNESVYTLIAPAGSTIGSYQAIKAGIIKGCEDCPAGYTELEVGVVYNILLEDDGSDSSATIEGAIPGAVIGSVELVGVVEGYSSYVVVTDDPLTEAEIDAYVAANAGSTLSFVSDNVASLCSTSGSAVAWVEGDSCKVSTEDYTIIIADDDCGNNRLAELQAAYPELTITAGTTGLCQTQYSTSVVTNLVCEQCAPEFNDIFVSEAPEPFDGVEWTKAPKTYSETALMGIRIKGKQAVLSGSENFRDDMFFMATSTRISVAGGYPTTVSESFKAGDERFSVKVLSIAEEPVNYGGNLREFEDISKRYWEGVSRHEGNNYGKFILGEESNLDPLAPYIDYVLTVRKNSYAQSFSTEKNETFHYHLYVQPGIHRDLEDVLNKLAAKAGIAPVRAYD